MPEIADYRIVIELVEGINAVLAVLGTSKPPLESAVPMSQKLDGGGRRSLKTEVQYCFLLSEYNAAFTTANLLEIPEAPDVHCEEMAVRL